MADCRKCAKWTVIDDDVFCANCGDRLRKLSLEVRDEDGRPMGEGDLLLYRPGSGVKTAERRLMLHVRNDGSLPVTLDDVKTEAPAGLLAVLTPENKPGGIAGALVPPAGEYKFTLKVNLPMAPERAVTRGKIIARGSGGVEPCALDVIIAPYPRDVEKQIKINLPAVLEVPEKTGWAEFTGSVLAQDTFAKLQAMSCDIPGVTVLSAQPSSDGPPSGEFKVAKTGEVHRFTLRVETGGWPEDDKGGGRQQQKGAILFSFAGLSKPVVHNVIIELRQPGRIECTVPRLNIPWVMYKKKAVKEFELINRGGMAVSASTGCLRPRDLWFCAELILNEDERRAGRIVIAPGKTMKGILTVDTSQLNDPMENGYASFVTVEFDDIDPYRLPVVIGKITPAVLPTYLAIDFGTTNSCCAVVSERMDAEIVLLDGSGTFRPGSAPPVPATPGEVSSIATTVSSMIVFESVQDKANPKFVIGAEARGLAATRIESTVESAKRFVARRDHRFYITDLYKNTVDYSAEDICAMIIRRIIDNAELSLKVRVQRVLATFPAAFGLAQTAALKKVYEERLGLEVHAFVLDESTAAAIHYLTDREKIREANCKSLLMLDVGGGTTDIALLEISKMPGSRPGFQNVSAKLLGTEGIADFGGENITGIIIDAMIDKCRQEYIRDKRIDSPQRVSILFEKISDLSDKPLFEKDKTLTNIANLYDRAEYAKRYLDAHPTVEMQVMMYVAVDGKADPTPHLMRFTLSRDEVNALIRNDVSDMMYRMKTLCVSELEGRGPDYICLAGKPSRMPYITEMIANGFGEPGKSYELLKMGGFEKECVALGGQDYSILTTSQSSSTLIKLQGIEGRLPYEIGVVISDHNRKLFRPAIRRRTAIGKDGCVGEVEFPVPESGIARIMVVENMKGLEFYDAAPNKFLIIGEHTFHLSDYDFQVLPQHRENAKARIRVDKERRLYLSLIAGPNVTNEVRLV